MLNANSSENNLIIKKIYITMKCIIIIIIYFSFIYLFCRRNGHMWLISSWKDEGLIEHVQYKYNHSFLIEEISYVTTVPRCNLPTLP